jgi:1-Cys peroxiredoxin 6
MQCDEKFPFPIVSDRNRVFSLYLNVLDAKCIDDEGIPLPCRATFVLTPDMVIQIMHFYPQTTGRNFKYVIQVSLLRTNL